MRFDRRSKAKQIFPFSSLFIPHHYLKHKHVEFVPILPPLLPAV